MDVQAVLDSRKAKYKTTDVSKEVDLQYDLGNLLVTDLNPLDNDSLRYNLLSYAKAVDFRVFIAQGFQREISETTGQR